VTDPAGNLYTYQYDANSRLTTILYPDATPADLGDNPRRLYHYEDPAFPQALTGVTDENGVRFATYAYDAQGRGIRTEHAGGVEQTTLAYHADGSSTVTDALGTARTYTFQTILGVARQTGLSEPCPTSPSPQTRAMTYDANGNVASRMDFNGNLSCYAYDLTRNLETVRLEGLAPGSACPANLAAYKVPVHSEQRKIETTWHATYRLPTQIAEAGRKTAFTYDSKGRLLTMSLKDTATKKARTWTYTYNANGQIKTVDGPRPNAVDVTTFAYYADSAADHAPGDLRKVTNALGQVTTFTSYDGHGRPLTVQYPNGQVITLAYDVRSRLTSQTVDGNTTALLYNSAGNLSTVTWPTGASLQYRYDAAHRLTGLQDSPGNQMELTLDPAGHHIEEDVYDLSHVLVKTRRQVFDALGRLAQTIGAGGQTTALTYDKNGNRTAITDPNGHTRNRVYDALDRPVSVTDPLDGVTSYTYDAWDRVTQVTDPNGLATSYTYDGLGNRIQESSPNSGTTGYSYDTAGNVKSKTDASGVTANYTYDALNRLTAITYPNGDGNVTYAYDAGTTGIGHLTSVTRNGVTTAFTYDRRGNLTSQAVTAGTTPLGILTYRYDDADQIKSIVYPSGRRVNYVRDTAGRIASVTTTVGGQTNTLAGTIGHLPFGAVKDLTFGNGLVLSRLFDQDYRLTGQALGTLQNLAYAYDPAGNLTGITDHVNGAYSQAFTYDELHRLLTANGNGAPWTWTYDADGNRLQEFRGGNQSTYNYLLTDQKLQSITGAGSKNFAYDANGNTMTWGGLTLGYGSDNRLQSVQQGQTTLARYGYDGLDRRVSKTVDGVATYYLYDPAGRLLAETDSGGGVLTEYVYLDGVPVAVIAADQVSYLHTNHLGAPTAATNASGNLVWAADYRPFGKAKLINPSITLNLRLPGQYFDPETELHYNYFRTYDPNIGRYLEPDPIGLAGGINSYAYVGNNPVNWIDPDGRFAWLPWAIGAGLFLWDTFGPVDPNPSHPDAIEPFDILPGPVGKVGKACNLAKDTATVQRWMSKAELEATRNTGLLRGGREGTHYVTDAANSDPLRARQRLALPQTPEVRVTMQVPKNALSAPSTVDRAFNMPGGGIERTATGNLPVRIIGVD